MRNFMLHAMSAAVLFSLSLMAQYTTADLGGTVVDSSAAPVPDAKVSVRNVQTGFIQGTITSTTGGFLFPRLPVGAYELKVEKNGFSTFTQSGITLAVNQAANLPVTLSVGGVSSVVTVSGQTELVTTRN